MAGYEPFFLRFYEPEPFLNECETAILYFLVRRFRKVLSHN